MTHTWRDDAACAGRAPQFDATIEGESPRDMKTRHEVAKQVCAGCPVIAQCRADFVRGIDGGVRFGQVFGLPRGAIVGGGNGDQRLRAKRRATKADVIARVMELTAQGMSAVLIADKLNTTPRAIVRYRAEGRHQAEQEAS